MPPLNDSIELVPILSLEPHPRNPRMGDIGAVMSSIASNGWFGAVLVQRVDGHPDTIAGGEHRWRALAALWAEGFTFPDGRHLSYDELAATVPLPPAGKVPVIPRAWTDEQTLRVLLADNRTSDLATYDEPELIAILSEFAESERGLLGLGYDGDDLDAAIFSLGQAESAAAARGCPAAPDEAADPPAVPETKKGDVWVLGDHRLICGDSRLAADYEALLSGTPADMIWTDPPYGVDYGAKNRFLQTIGRSDRLEEDIAGDGSDPEALGDLLGAAFNEALAASRPGAVWFVAAPPGPQLAVFARELLRIGVWRQLLVWAKNRAVFGRSDYHYQHESLFYGWTPGAAHRPPPTHSTTSLWAFDAPQASKLHPTMKPVALIAAAVENHTEPGGTVLDPFAGSGSTLMACEQTARSARCIEISPAYCDVICERFERHSGVVPIRASTGEAVRFVADVAGELAV